MGVSSLRETLSLPHFNLSTLPNSDKQAAIFANLNWFGIESQAFEVMSKGVESIADLVKAVIVAGDFQQSAVLFSPSRWESNRCAVRRSAQTLFSEVGYWARLFATADCGFSGIPRRFVCLAPAHQAFGFTFGVLLPRYLGVPVIDVGDPAEFCFGEGDVVLGSIAPRHDVNSMLHQLSSTVRVDRFNGLNAATSNPVRWVVGAPLVDVCITAEAGGIGWRSSSGRVFRVLSGRRLAAVSKAGACEIRFDGTCAREAVRLSDRIDAINSNSFLLRESQRVP